MYAVQKDLTDYLEEESQTTQTDRASKQNDYELIVNDQYANAESYDEDDEENVTEEEYLSDDGLIPFVGARTVAYVDDQVLRNNAVPEDSPPSYEEAMRQSTVIANEVIPSSITPKTEEWKSVTREFTLSEKSQWFQRTLITVKMTKWT